MRAIGVSNFMPGHLDALLKRATVVPAVNQVEVHPYFTQPDVQAADATHGILTQAWSPVGGITSYRGNGTSTSQDGPAHHESHPDLISMVATENIHRAEFIAKSKALSELNTPAGDGTSAVRVHGSVPGALGLFDPVFLPAIEFAGVA